MAKQTINLGTGANARNGSSLRAGGQIINDNFSELYGYREHNVLDYGAVGNYSDATDGGQDDTTYIQAAIDAAGASSGNAVVVFPSRRAYKITATLTVPNGVELRGIGFQQPGGSSGSPAKIVWRGTAGGTMILVGTEAGAGNTSNPFRHLYLVGGRSLSTITAWAGTAIRFGQGVDSGTIIENCWFAYFANNGSGTGNALEFSQGSTNSVIKDGRFDRICGYPIYADLDDANGGNYIAQWLNLTWDNWSDSDGTPYNNGFAFLDGTTDANGANYSDVLMVGCHLEVNGTINRTWTGTISDAENPSHQRGVIRLGIPPNVGTNMSHKFRSIGTVLSAGTGVPSFSFVHATSPLQTTAYHSARIWVDIDVGGREPTSASASTGNIIPVGGVPASWMPLYANNGNAHVVRAGGNTVSANHVIPLEYVSYQPATFSGLRLRSYTQSTVPAGHETAYTVAVITDSNTTTNGETIASTGANTVLACHNGSVWKVISAL